MPSTEDKSQNATAKDRRITLRFKAAEWGVVQGDIEASGLNVNEYFRQVALESPVPRKVRRSSLRDRLGDYAAVYSRWLGELGKIGSNLNQLIKQLNVAIKLGELHNRPSNQELLAVVEELEVLLQTAAEELRQSLVSSNAPTEP